jgi:hypothetical protein
MSVIGRTQRKGPTVRGLIGALERRAERRFAEHPTLKSRTIPTIALKPWKATDGPLVDGRPVHVASIVLTLVVGVACGVGWMLAGAPMTGATIVMTIFLAAMNYLGWNSDRKSGPLSFAAAPGSEVVLRPWWRSARPWMMPVCFSLLALPAVVMPHDTLLLIAVSAAAGAAMEARHLGRGVPSDVLVPARVPAGRDFAAGIRPAS